MSNNLSNDLLLDLKSDIFHRAKLFIEDMGGFVPFGSELVDSKIKQIIIYDDSKEVFQGIEFINRLENNFSEKLRSEIIQAAAVAYDVSANFNNADGVSEKRDALCLKISTDGEKWSEDYYPYMIIDGKCVWG